MINYFDELITRVDKTLVTDILKGAKIDLPQGIITAANAHNRDAVCQYVEANRQLYFMELGYDLALPENIKAMTSQELFDEIERAAPSVSSSDYEAAYDAFTVILCCCVQLQVV